MLELETLFMLMSYFYVVSIYCVSLTFFKKKGKPLQIFEKIFKIIGLKHRIVKHS